MFFIFFLFNRNKLIVITWPRSGKFLKRKSCDNNHPELHPSQFDLHCNASSSRAPTWSRGSVSLRTRLPTHSSPYALVSLRTCLPTHSTSHDGEKRWRGRMTRKDQHLSKIVHLSRYAVCHPRSSQYAARKLSCRLDAIDTPPLCGSQPRHQYWSE